MARRGGGNILGGAILVAIGLWFLLDNLGFALPDLGDLWPLAPLLGGLALTLTYLAGREKDSGVLIPGCAGTLIGIFFLAITLGPLTWNDLEEWWPIFPVIGGFSFIVMFIFARTKRDAGVLVPGCGGLMVGLFFFLITLGPFHWDDLGRLWPAFPLIGGVSFLAVWAVERKDVGLLVPAGLGLAVGLIGFAFTLGGLGLKWLTRGWPVVVILIGLMIVGQSLFGKGRLER